MIKTVCLGLLCGAAVFTVGILIGHFGITKSSSNSAPSWVKDVAQDVNEGLIEEFLSEVDNVQIKENLRYVEKSSCLGCVGSLIQIQHVQEIFSKTN